ncbi:MAG: type VI secretion system tip protein VgrG [Polyangiaceae bacterium]|nr:type VI secretion system tip protein VgrG [Polyangiaceae bacterium]
MLKYLVPAISAVGNGLSLALESGIPFDVRRFCIRERMSDFFTIELEAHCEDANVDLSDVVERRARFELHRGVESRGWSGIVSSARFEEAADDGLSTYSMTVVPSMWLMTQRKNRRVFQHVAEPDIVMRLLDEWQVPHEKRLSEAYASRNYRVQYDESDASFLRRMLEEAGISFFLVTESDKTRVVLSDAPERAEARMMRLPFRADTTMVSGEYVTRVRARAAVAPGRVAMRDRDDRLPAGYPLFAAADAKDADRRLEQFESVPGAFRFESSRAGGGTPVADDRGAVRSDEKMAKTLARKRLEALRHDACAVEFETNALDLAPGVVVHIDGHPRSECSNGLLIVETRIEGTFDSEWTHSCCARSIEAPYRPPLSTPKPVAKGIERATVVGPPGEEIHCDELGRVRVQFPWDRENAWDDESSCWVPVSQGAAGAGFGMLNIPRVGHEVLVEFIGGDPDLPVITGRVHTLTHQVPYALPANKTQSGWRTATTPAGHGYNELVFEDKRGAEFIRVHAERDMMTTVERDERVTVRRDRATNVVRDDEVRVGRHATRLVQQNSRESIGLHAQRSVGVNDISDVGGDQMLTICGKQTIAVGASSETVIGGSQSEEIASSKTVLVGDRHTIVCGGASIIMESSGKITLCGSDIQLLSSGPVSIAGTTVSIGGTSVSVNASGAIGVAGASVKLSGDPVDTN